MKTFLLRLGISSLLFAGVLLTYFWLENRQIPVESVEQAFPSDLKYALKINKVSAFSKMNAQGKINTWKWLQHKQTSIKELQKKCMFNDSDNFWVAEKRNGDNFWAFDKRLVEKDSCVQNAMRLQSYKMHTVQNMAFFLPYTSSWDTFNQENETAEKQKFTDFYKTQQEGAIAFWYNNSIEAEKSAWLGELKQTYSVDFFDFEKDTWRLRINFENLSCEKSNNFDANGTIPNEWLANALQIERLHDKDTYYKITQSNLQTENVSPKIAREDSKQEPFLPMDFFYAEEQQASLQNESIGEKLQRQWYWQKVSLGDNWCMLNVLMRVREKPVVETPVAEEPKQNSVENRLFATQSWEVINHNDKSIEILSQNKQGAISLQNPKGKTLWKLDFNKAIAGKVLQIDALKNGKLQMVFVADNFLYVMDRLGRKLSGFPILLKAKSNLGVAVLDYENNKNYRFWVPLGNKLYVYDLQGKLLSDFKNPQVSYNWATLPLHFKLDGHDYILIWDEKGNVYLLNRKGEIKHRQKTLLKQPLDVVLARLKVGKTLTQTQLELIYNENKKQTLNLE